MDAARRTLIWGLGGVAMAACNNADAVALAADFLPHPDSQAASVEYFISRPQTQGPWPLIVLLHGHQAAAPSPGGRVFGNWRELDRLAAMGFLATAVSLPGFGQSTGPADFAGPFTQNAVAGIISHLLQSGQIAPAKAVVLGISLGALTGAILAARDERISGLALISGAYDFSALFANTRSTGVAEMRAQFERQTGGSEAALRSRSALLHVASIRARALILNGAHDDRTDPAQAQRFAAALVAAGLEAEAVIYREQGHSIPFEIRRARVDAFLRGFLD